MTPAERTAARIAQNRAITERIAEKKVESPKKPPQQSSGQGTRATPEERAQLGSFIRKVQR